MAAGVRGGRKLKEFYRKAKAAQKRGGVRMIEVGFFATARYQTGVPVPLVAAVNEFGSKKAGVPERPFFRQALVGIERELRPIIVGNINPRTMTLDHQTAGLIGQAASDRVKRSIATLKTPPNAPSTIARKGSSNPLVDSGKLRQSASYRVVT